jgi:hypothetical protein
MPGVDEIAQQHGVMLDEDRNDDVRVFGPCDLWILVAKARVIASPREFVVD